MSNSYPTLEQQITQYQACPTRGALVYRVLSDYWRGAPFSTVQLPELECAILCQLAKRPTQPPHAVVVMTYLRLLDRLADRRKLDVTGSLAMVIAACQRLQEYDLLRTVIGWQAPTQQTYAGFVIQYPVLFAGPPIQCRDTPPRWGLTTAIPPVIQRALAAVLLKFTTNY